MVNKTISIPYDLNEKLKEEDNASALISSILNQHYDSLRGVEVKSPKDIQVEVIELQKEIKEKKKEIEELKVIEITEEKTEEEKAEIKKKRDEATEKLKEAILSEI